MPGEIEITLDQVRKVKFRFRDIEELCRRLGNITLVQLAERAAGGDPQFVLWGLWAGLRHEDQRLTPNKVLELLDKHLESGGGGLVDICSLLDSALVQSGVFGKRSQDGGPKGGDGPPGP